MSTYKGHETSLEGTNDCHEIWEEHLSVGDAKDLVIGMNDSTHA